MTATGLDTDLLGRQLRSLSAVTAWLDQIGAALPIAAGVQLYAHQDTVAISFMPTISGHVDEQKAIATEIVRVIGGTWAKSFSADRLYLRQHLDFGADVCIYLDRDAACTRRVVGTRKVERVVPAVEAQPEHVVVTTVEDVEWDCGSILAEGGAS